MNSKFTKISIKNTQKLPKTSGVYLFYQKNKIIYIGKAINIQKRVKNHFHPARRSFSEGGTIFKDNILSKLTTKIGYLETNSEITALILEANLIKKNQPKFNVVWKDDKKYFYVAIAQNNKKIPFVYITHQPRPSVIPGLIRNPEITQTTHALDSRFRGNDTKKNAHEATQYIGPFIEGNALKKTLKFLRKAIPYYTNKSHSKNKCMWCHLGLCPGPEPDLLEYKKNIKKLILILKGKKSAVLRSLKNEMEQLSKENKFEEAGKIRDKFFSLEKIMAHAHILNSEFGGGPTSSELSGVMESLAKIIGLKKPVNRIECYDVSNIQGKNATGSMVVFINGLPDKSQYKKFKIKWGNESRLQGNRGSSIPKESGPNDIAMLEEILKRRFNHPEWEYPEIILIDGGKAQLNIAIKAKNLNSKSKLIKIVSIAKGKQELFIEGKIKPIPLKLLPQEVYNLIKQLDDEAHRFAITYHKKLRKKAIFQ
jgi:excinuclease ABC subunit C